MNSENSKTPKPHILILKLINKLDLRIGKKVIVLSNLSIYYTWKAHTITINLRYLNQNGMMNLIYQMDLVLYQIFKIILNLFLKKHGESVDKPSVWIYVSKIENRVIFKIKNGYSLEFLIPETIKLLASTKNKITKGKNGENVPHLEITKVVLVHCNILNNDY